MIHAGELSESLTGTEFVLFVEDDDDLRELFVRLVEAFLERPCVAVGSYEELVALGEDALKCRGAILDINLGPNRLSGIAARGFARRGTRTDRLPDGPTPHHPSSSRQTDSAMRVHQTHRRRPDAIPCRGKTRDAAARLVQRMRGEALVAAALSVAGMSGDPSRARRTAHAGIRTTALVGVGLLVPC